MIQASRSSSIFRPTGVNFRAVAPADEPFLAGLHASRRHDALATVDWPPEQKAKFLLDELRDEEAHLAQHYPGMERLVIELGTLPIGRIYLQRVLGEIRLLDFALAPRARGAGIGTALLRELLDEARGSGARIVVHVEPDNPANRLFKRLGFALLETRDGYDFMAWDPAIS